MQDQIDKLSKTKADSGDLAIFDLKLETKYLGIFEFNEFKNHLSDQFANSNISIENNMGKNEEVKQELQKLIVLCK